MAVDWSLLSNMPNPGETFNNAFQQGIQQNRERTGRNALASLVQNPNDPKALAALAQVAPEQAMQFRSQQAQLSREQIALHQDNILKGAQILRSVQPKDQASYSQALAMAQQAGVDLTGVPQVYNPQYVQGVIHLADAWKPEPDPSPIREFHDAIDQKLLPPNTTYEQFLQLKNPGMNAPVVLPQNYTMVQGGGQPQAQAPVTATGPNGQRLQLNPQTNQWEPMGGQTPQASGGFPSSYSPK